jgi:hypothetical protein
VTAAEETVVVLVVEDELEVEEVLPEPMPVSVEPRVVDELRPDVADLVCPLGEIRALYVRGYEHA